MSPSRPGRTSTLAALLVAAVSAGLAVAITVLSGDEDERARTPVPTDDPAAPRARTPAPTDGPAAPPPHIQHALAAGVAAGQRPGDTGFAEGALFDVDFEGIRDAMAQATPAITECYEGFLAADPSLSGRLAIAFEIGEMDGVGAVQGLELLDDLTDAHIFEACVLHAVSELAFVAPAGPVRVTYPFVFRGED